MALCGVGPRPLGCLRGIPARLRSFFFRLLPTMARGNCLKRAILSVAFTLLLCPGAFAQVQPTPGVIPPFSTIETHEYDSVNLATLGIQLNVPVRSKAGHIPFSFALKGMAQIQYMTVSNPPPNTPPHYFAGAPGLAGQENHIGGGPPRVQSSIVIGPCGLAGGWIGTMMPLAPGTPRVLGILSLLVAAPPTAGRRTLRTAPASMSPFPTHPLLAAMRLMPTATRQRFLPLIASPTPMANHFPRLGPPMAQP